MGLRGVLLGRATERDNTVVTGTDARKVGVLCLMLAGYLTYTSMDGMKSAYQDLLRPTPVTRHPASED
jgi:hypothetical protein